MVIGPPAPGPGRPARAGSPGSGARRPVQRWSEECFHITE